MKNKFYIQQLNPTKDELAKITDLPKFAKEELTPSQIIVFASLYPAFKDTKENEWFSKFSQLPEVATGIKNALAITPVEREKETNTGKQNVETGHLVKTG